MKYCKKCGVLYATDVCPKCGIEYPDETQPPAEEKPERIRRGWIALVIGVPALIGVIYGVITLLSRIK